MNSLVRVVGPETGPTTLTKGTAMLVAFDATARRKGSLLSAARWWHALAMIERIESSVRR